MPELLEAPAPVTTPAEVSETDALKASFNTAMKAEGLDPKATDTDEPTEGAKPTLIPAKPTDATKPDPAKADGESIVPEQFTGKPAEEKKEDPTEILSAKDRADAVAKLGGKAQESFNKLETAAKARITALNAELAEARKKAEAVPVGPSKEHEEALKAAQERATQLEQQLERAAFADSPRFQKYGKEITAELDTAKGYLEGTNVSPQVLDLAASQTGQARLKTLRDSGMDTETIAAIGPHLARADAIRRERDGALESWKTEYTKEQQAARDQASRQEAEMRQREEAVFNEVKARVTKNNPAFTKVDGHEKWNAMVDQNFKDVEDFAMGRRPLPELFEMGFDGASKRTYQVMLEEAQKVNKQQYEELVRLRAAQPGTGHTNTTTATTAPVSDEQAYKANFNAAMAQVGQGRGGG